MLDILYYIYFVVYLPVLVLRGKWHGGFAERFGFFPKTLETALSSGENIWVHAVSVGEVALLDGLIKGLLAKYPGRKIVLSVTTVTGHELALKRYGAAVRVIWSPLDLSWVVARFVRRIRPVAYIVAETELWPNLFSCLSAGRVPIVVVNGRISDEAYSRYRMARWFLKKTVLQASLLCVQSKLDAQRFIALGADPTRVTIAGNLKFDLVLPGSVMDELEAKRVFGFSATKQIFVAASTHPGEEQVVCEAFASLRSEFSELRLVIVPRHPQRAAEVAGIVGQHHLKGRLFTVLHGAILGDDDVLVVDAVGHLVDLYRIADVVFIGKSLGIPRRGGQNPIEPAAFGKPVIVGPHMENFRDVMRVFREAGAVVEISRADQLAGAVRDILNQPQRRAGLGVRAKVVVDQNRGAAQRTLDAINL